MSTTTATKQQRHDALKVANETRNRRAQLKRDLADGRVQLFDVLERPEWWAERMRVHDVLLATPGIGWVTAGRILRIEGISPSRSIGSLTDRQRRHLLSVLANVNIAGRRTVLP